MKDAEADHRDTLVCANNLALLYDDLAREADAEPLVREVLAGRRRSLGDEHSQTLNSVNNLALFLSKWRRVPADSYVVFVSLQ